MGFYGYFLSLAPCFADDFSAFTRMQTANILDLQRGHIDTFVSRHNSSSSYKISNLAEMNINDESGQYYRKTNTYGSTQGNDKLVAMHGYIDNSDIWIISCSSTTPNHMAFMPSRKTTTY